MWSGQTSYSMESGSGVKTGLGGEGAEPHTVLEESLPRGCSDVFWVGVACDPRLHRHKGSVTCWV